MPNSSASLISSAEDITLRISEHYCLFGMLENASCSYDISNPPIFLGLGGALAALGLILAVEQLFDRKSSLTLQLKSWYIRNTHFILIGLGLFFAAFATILSQIPLEWLPNPLGIPVFYELLAYMCLVAAPTLLIYHSRNSRKLFTKKSAKKFYQTLESNLASKSGEDDVNATLNILLANFDDVCKEAKSDTETGGYARACLDVILSDESIAFVLATKRLDALRFIISSFIKYKINSRDVRYGFQTLINTLYFHEQSFLFKHLKKSGLSLSSDVYEIIFGSPELISNFDLFGWSVIDYKDKKSCSLKQIEVFIRCIKTAVNTYYLNDSVPPHNVTSGIKLLSEVFDDLTSRINRNKVTDSDSLWADCEEVESINEISNYLTEGYRQTTYYNHEKYSKRTLNFEKSDEVKVPDVDSALSVNEAVSGAMLSSLQGISKIESGRDTYLQVLKYYDSQVERDEKYVSGYEKVFTKWLWLNVAWNVKNKMYPNITKATLIFGGFLALDTKEGGWRGEQGELVRRLLYVDLLPEIEAGAEMVNREKMVDVILPKNIVYKDGVFNYAAYIDEYSFKEIPKPNKLVSAFEGMDKKEIDEATRYLR